MVGEDRTTKQNHSEVGLIGVLEEVQSKFGYLPADELKAVAVKFNRPLVDVYGVATFYKAFSLTPRGEHLVSCCLGTACHVWGAPRIAEELQKRLGVAPNETTPDRKFTFHTVNCLGACALGPIVVIDGHYFSQVKASQVPAMLEQARKGLDPSQMQKGEGIFPVDVACPRCNHSLMDFTHPIDGFPSIYINLAFAHQHGWLRLSSLYGSYNVEVEYEIPHESVVDMFCPHCNSELSGATECTECGLPMVPMMVRGGGIVQICRRRGCRGHMLDVSGLDM